MLNADQIKWDQRYAEGAYAERAHPSPLLTHWAPPANNGRACDIACGRGRNSRYLAELGYAVDGYDISPVGLELAAAAHQDMPIDWIQRDVLASGLPGEKRYRLIIMFRFVALELLARLVNHLDAQGTLIVENHLRWAGAESLAGPKSERFRVAAGAQRAALGDTLEIVYEQEGLAVDPDGSNVALAQLVARNAR